MNLRTKGAPIALRRNVRLSPLSTFRIGGSAQYFCRVQRPEDLVEVAKWAKGAQLNYKLVAGGSNVVFPDRRLQGLLVQLRGGVLTFNRTRCTVDAGVLLAEVIEQSIQAGLAGLETLSGIPGTMGGAIVGNAGAYGHSISEVVDRVEIWDGRRRRWLSQAECRFEYRESIFKRKPYLVLRAALSFKRGRPKELRLISRRIIRLRLKKYKPGLRCPGSFFKNVLASRVSRRSLRLIDSTKIIEGKIPTGYLLEQVGAKGMRVGGIVIAKFHGNLFINNGRGAARDVRALARILKRRVNEQFGITLEEEIRYF